MQEKIDRFLETTRNNPPTKPRAFKLYGQYLSILESMELEQWERFFQLLKDEATPSEAVLTDPAVAELQSADTAFFLLNKMRDADKHWYIRYKNKLIKVGAWIMGIPVVGSIIEWLLSGGGGFFGFINYPDIFQTEEYVLLAATGAWIGILSIVRSG